MKDAEETDLSAEMFRVAGNGQEGLRGGPEEDAVNDFFVVKGNTGQLFRDGEHDMEISDRQQFGLPVFKPLCPLRVLALRAVAVPACNGDLSITCLMESLF